MKIKCNIKQVFSNLFWMKQGALHLFYSGILQTNMIQDIPPAPCSCSVHSVSPLKVTKSLSSYNSALCICQWFIQQEGIALDVLSTVIRFIALEGGSVPVALSSAFISQGSFSAFQYTILILTFDAQPKKAFDISPIRSVFHFSTNKNMINQQVLGILWVARM